MVLMDIPKMKTADSFHWEQWLNQSKIIDGSTPMKTGNAKTKDSSGQSTAEFAMVAAMVTGSMAIYPMIMNAFGVYLKSMGVVLNLPLA